MAERLTEVGMFIDTPVYIIKNGKKSEAVDKLAQLENMLEKYGIESLDILEQELKIAREIERLKNKEFDLSNSAIVDKDFYKDLTREIEKLETDRDTWKKACELASETLKQVMGKPLWIGGNIPTPEVKDSDYFYQQAKKEGENETKNENNKSGN